MKKFLLCGLAAAALLAAAPIESAVAGVGVLTVVNNTQYPFVRFYARNLMTGNLQTAWMEGVAARPIFPGEVRTFYFDTEGTCANWNFEVDRPFNHMTKVLGVPVCGLVWTWTINPGGVDNFDGPWNGWGTTWSTQ
jgi:hypothetical protein